MSPADLAADTVRCLTDLGQLRRAPQLMDEGMSLLPATRSKTRSMFLAYQAETHLRAGDADIAADTATRACDLATRINAPRCVTMVRDLKPKFAPYGHITGVDELLGPLRAVQGPVYLVCVGPATY
ncbi:hypothetical protein [Streptomyces sp. NPDC002550]